MLDVVLSGGGDNEPLRFDSWLRLETLLLD